MTKRTKKAWAKWRRLVSEQARSSGLDVATFCRERALCRPYFFVWKKRLRERAAVKFLEVQVAEPALGDSRIEIRLQFNIFWMGHKPKTMSEIYSHLFEEGGLRLAEAEAVGFGFELPKSPSERLVVCTDCTESWR